jgi:arsenate reductase-like glutaredoxin family protein
MARLVRAMTNGKVCQMVRTQEPCYAELGLEKADDDTPLAAHPSLMQRPVVVTDRGAKLCGSGEDVEGLL